jgi:hypothetical protein
LNHLIPAFPCSIPRQFLGYKRNLNNRAHDSGRISHILQKSRLLQILDVFLPRLFAPEPAIPKIFFNPARCISACFSLSGPRAAHFKQNKSPAAHHPGETIRPRAG